MLIDPKAAKVRGVAKLTKKDARSSTGLFLLEGPQGLKEALDRPKLIVELYATDDAVERFPDLFERAESARIQVQLVSEPVLKALTDTTTPQGVVAVCEQIDVTLQDIIDAKPRLVALLANIRVHVFTAWQSSRCCTRWFTHTTTVVHARVISVVCGSSALTLHHVQTV